MPSPSEFGRFLSWSGALTLTGVAACVALVVAADPYSQYRLLERPAFNQKKPQPERYQKEIKLAGVRAAKADLLILGNSRAEIGLDPDNQALRRTGLSPYNLALAGTRIQVAREQLEQLAADGHQPRQLIVGAEFLDFLIDPKAPPPAAPATVLPDAMATVAWRFDTLFSIDSVLDAVATVRMQNATEVPTMTARGFNPLLEYRKLARSEGYHALFQQRADDYAKRFAKLPRGLLAANGSTKEFEQMRAVLSAGAAAGARVDVVIYPYHAQIMALMERSGLAPVFDQWKTLLAQQVEALRAAHPGVRITLWDFSGYGQYQCEPIPARGDRTTQTTWYWEAGHFKAALGDIMLERMLTAADKQAEPAFGMALTPATIKLNRERIARERSACVLAAPALFSAPAAPSPAPG
jgi:hypothetical protein